MVVVSPMPPAGVPPFHMPYPQGFNPFYPYGMGMPSPMFFAPQFGMGGLGNTPLPWGADQSIVPSAGPSHTQPETMRLSSSPPMPDGDIHEFCKQYNLSKDVKRGLEKLEFQIGDDIKNLPKEVYESACFTYLSWQRVLKAYSKHKHHAKLSC
jgi:hypothetical protein